jgi:hypothetical protein
MDACLKHQSRSRCSSQDMVPRIRLMYAGVFFLPIKAPLLALSGLPSKMMTMLEVWLVLPQGLLGASSLWENTIEKWQMIYVIGDSFGVLNGWQNKYNYLTQVQVRTKAGIEFLDFDRVCQRLAAATNDCLPWIWLLSGSCAPTLHPLKDFQTSATQGISPSPGYVSRHCNKCLLHG